MWIEQNTLPFIVISGKVTEDEKTHMKSFLPQDINEYGLVLCQKKHPEMDKQKALEAIKAFWPMGVIDEEEEAQCKTVGGSIFFQPLDKWHAFRLIVGQDETFHCILTEYINPRYEDSFGAMGIYFWSYDKKTKFFWLDEGASILLGVQDKDWKMKLLAAAKRVHPKDWIKLKKPIQIIKKFGRMDTQIRLKLAETEEYNWFHVRIRFYEEGKNRGTLFGTLQDISFYKDEADETLKTSFEYQAFFDGADESFLLMDVSTGPYQILRVNRAMERALRVNRSEIEGLLVNEIDSEKIRNFLNRNLQNTLLYQCKHASEMMTTEINGEKQNIRVTFTPVIMNKSVIRVLISMEEITQKIEEEQIAALKQEELKKMEASLNVSGITVFTLGEKGFLDFTYVSENVNQFGVSASELMKNGEAFLQVIDPEDKQKIEDIYQKFNNSMYKNFSHHYKIRGWDGTVIFVEEHVTIERNQYGNPYAYHGYILASAAREDASDTRFKQGLEDVEKINVLQRVGTDLIAQLASNFGVLQLLRFTPISETQSKYVKMMENSLRRMNDTVESLVEVSGAKKEEERHDKDSICFEDLLKGLQDKYGKKAKFKKLQFKTHVSAQVPGEMLGDGKKLNKILNNVIDNSIKFTQEGGVLLSVDKWRENRSEIWIEIEIRDTGVGISEEEKEKVFEPFYKSPAHAKWNGASLGLGLSVCRNLVRIQGGEILLSSRGGSGTSVKIRLPFFQNQMAIKELMPDRENAKAKSQKRKRMLLVGQDFDQINKIRSIIEDVVDEVDLAETPEDAMQKAGTYPYDVALFDVSKETKGFIDALQIIRAKEGWVEGKRTAVGVIVAEDIETGAALWRSTGVDACFSKKAKRDDFYEGIIRFVEFEGNHS